MPRVLEGRARKPIVSLRIDPDLLQAVKAVNPNLGRAVDAALRLWLAREKRRQPKGDPLGEHLYPPTAREMAVGGRHDGTSSAARHRRRP